MDTERTFVVTVGICFVAFMAFASSCQRAADAHASATNIEYARAGLHQDVGSGKWVK